MRLGVLLTHPVQYMSPWFANVATRADLTVFYGLRQTPEGQARAGFDVKFEWDVPLLEGYSYRFLNNVSRDPGLHHFSGCDNPSISDAIACGGFDALFVHGWNRKCYWQAILAARRHRVPVLIRSDTQLESPRHWALRAGKFLGYRAVLPQLGDYLYPGARARRYLRHYGVSPENLHHLPHMVDTNRISASAMQARENGERKRLRVQANVGEADTVFLFVGKLIPKKRPDRLLRSFQQFFKRRTPAERKCHLWLVGDGPMRAELEQYSNAHNLPVRFLGFINQMQLPIYYAAADCLVLPSDASETWGLVVNEGFAAGIPAIVSGEVGCAETMIEQGRTGWVYNGGDDALSDAFATAMAGANGISVDAIGRMNELHSFKIGTDRLIDIVDIVRRRTSRSSDLGAPDNASTQDESGRT